MVDFAKRMEMVVVNTYCKKTTTYEWRKVHTGGLYLKQKVQSEKQEVVSGGESN